MKPQKVTDVELVFGGKMKKLLPLMNEIPDEFKLGRTKFNKVFSSWFFSGLNQYTKFILKDGIDVEMALNHLMAIMCSFEPKHEHKEAGCAYLMSLWFDDIVDYEKE